MSQLTLAGASSVSVKKHTGKTWDEWIKILNKKSCQKLTHQQLVALLKKDFKLKGWWQQVVARGYQVFIGVRVPNQTLKGTYTTTATKTLKTTAKKLYTFLTSEDGQNVWLQPLYPVTVKEKTQFECDGGIFGEIRTVAPGKKIRFTWINEDWPKKTIVHVNVIEKPAGKCMIAIDHTDLPTARAKAEMHARWRKAVDDVALEFSETDSVKKK